MDSDAEPGNSYAPRASLGSEWTSIENKIETIIREMNPQLTIPRAPSGELIVEGIVELLNVKISQEIRPFLKTLTNRLLKYHSPLSTAEVSPNDDNNDVLVTSTVSASECDPTLEPSDPTSTLSSSQVSPLRLEATSSKHMCEVCGKSFAVAARLTRHLRTHTLEKPFPCEVCGKKFSTKENLVVHNRTHTHERPYKCTYCGRGFEHSGKLQRHVRTHTGEKPHVCHVCGKRFIQSGQLQIHLRSHNGEKPYGCEEVNCGKRFTCSKQLRVHQRIHTGFRPYKCTLCDKSFAYKHVLKMHSMSHLGTRVYKCALCVQSYSSKKDLDRHLKEDHVMDSSDKLIPMPGSSSPATSKTVYTEAHVPLKKRKTQFLC